MTETVDWKPVATCLLGSWPNQVAAWGREGIAAYCAELQRRGVTVEAALTALDAAGGDFPPSAPALADACRTDRASTPVAAWALCEEAMRRFACSVYSEEFDARHQAAIDWIAERDPVVAWWAAQRGLFQGPGSLGQEPVNGEYGGAVRHRLEKEYEGVVRQAEERRALGEPPVPAGALIVGRKQLRQGGMGELVESLRPARQLEEGER